MAPLSFNKKAGPLAAGPGLRQAINAALDPKAVMTAAYQSFHRLDPSLMQKETRWWTDAGKDAYNQHDQAKSRSLAEAAGYSGTPLRILAPRRHRRHGLGHQTAAGGSGTEGRPPVERR